MESEYIFIMGAGRSGSKIYLNILNMSEDIEILPELGYWTPWKFDIIDLMSKYSLFKNLNEIDYFLNDLSSRKIKSSYWNMVCKGEINFNKDEIKKLIKKKKLQKKDFLTIILEYTKLKNNCKRVGAKFPLHVSKIDFLLKNFPKAKIIQITRNPHPTIISHSKKLIYKKEKNFFKNPIIYIKYYFFVLHGIVDYNWSSWIYFKNKKNNRYLIMKFEDIITNPKENIQILCNFLNIEYNEIMLNPPAVDSSYKRNIKRGFDKNALTNWKKQCNIFERIIISILTIPGKIFYAKCNE